MPTLHAVTRLHLTVSRPLDLGATNSLQFVMVDFVPPLFPFLLHFSHRVSFRRTLDDFLYHCIIFGISVLTEYRIQSSVCVFLILLWAAVERDIFGFGEEERWAPVTALVVVSRNPQDVRSTSSDALH